jgi:hypothetical protein
MDSEFEVFATLLPHESRKHLSDTGYHVFSSDVTSDEDAARLVSEIDLITKGNLDVLVNNAQVLQIEGDGLC